MAARGGNLSSKIERNLFRDLPFQPPSSREMMLASLEVQVTPRCQRATCLRRFVVAFFLILARVPRSTPETISPAPLALVAPSPQSILRHASETLTSSCDKSRVYIGMCWLLGCRTLKPHSGGYFGGGQLPYCSFEGPIMPIDLMGVIWELYRRLTAYKLCSRWRSLATALTETFILGSKAGLVESKIFRVRKR